jgi:hypothetical protein
MPISNQRLKRITDNLIVVSIVFTLIPLLFFALMDEQYWSVLDGSFGLRNSWYLFTVDLHVSHSDNIYTYTYPNNPFLLFFVTVIALNVFYYLIIKRIKQDTTNIPLPPNSSFYEP